LFVVLLVAAIVAGVVAYVQTQRTEAQRLAKQHRDVCMRLQLDLETIVHTPRARTDLHARMAYHHLDEGLMLLCFGKPAVVDSSNADDCWVAKGSDDCYLELARQLLDAYRRR
jgi:hypothetical protein